MTTWGAFACPSCVDQFDSPEGLTTVPTLFHLTHLALLMLILAFPGETYPRVHHLRDDF